MGRALDALLPDTYDVEATYNVPDALDVGRHRVILWSATVRPGAALGLRQVEVTAWLLTGVTGPDVDDVLDDALAELLDVLDGAPSLAWSEAERGVFADTFPGYRITLTTQHRKD